MINDVINSIIKSKEEIRQAIINKGVDVPENATIDTYAEYIGKINVVLPTLEDI